MKNYGLLFFLLLTPFFALAQGNNCGDTEPSVQCPADLTLCVDEQSDAITITNSPTLPDTEYIIVDHAQMSTSVNGGFAIVGVDLDGSVVPSDFGIVGGDQMSIIPITYDLQLIQNLIDQVLTGLAFPFPPITCCQAIAAAAGTDICQMLNDAGINSGSDITSASQLFPLFQGQAADPLSIADFVDGVNELNTQLQSAPGSCGGGTTICYAYGAGCTFDVLAPSLVYASPNHTTSCLHQAGIDILSSASVPSGINVQYEAGECIVLSDFEVVLGGEFCATIVPCN